MLFARSLCWATVALALCAIPSPAQEAQTYTFAITEVWAEENLEEGFGPFVEKLGELTGYQFTLYPVEGAVNAITAMKHELVDFVLTGPAEYVRFAAETDAEPVAGITRPDLYTVIVTLANSGVTTLQELEYKTVAFGERGSLNGHLQPKYMLEHNSLERVNVKAEHMSEMDGFNALIERDVVAWAGASSTFWYLAERDEYKPFGRYRVLARGGDRPGDVFIASDRVPQSVRRSVKNAFEDHGPALLEALLSWEGNGRYNDSRLFTDIDDSSFDQVRDMYNVAGYERLVVRSSLDP